VACSGQKKLHLRRKCNEKSPCRNPRPSPHSLPVGPAVLWASAEPVRWVQGELLKFRPLDFGPPDKDDAVPRVRKADGGKCEGGPAVGPGRNRYTVQRSLRRLSRTDVRGAHDSVRPPPAGAPTPHVISFPGGPATTMRTGAESEVRWVRAELFNRRPQAGTDGQEGGWEGNCDGGPVAAGRYTVN
jgi:hypothetical protein